MEAVNLTRSGQFTVSPMATEDLSSVVTLETECGLSSRGVDGYQKMLSDPNAVLLVAIEDDLNRYITGMLSGVVVIDELQIDNMAVALRHRRKGVGQMLLADALSRAQNLGARRAILEVRSTNSPARAFYEKQGFMIVGIRRQYYAAPPDDALLLSLEIRGES